MPRKGVSTPSELQRQRDVAARAVDPTRKCPGKKQSGAPCGFLRGFKTDHPGYGYCHVHGGSTQAGKVHAARERGQEIAAEQKKRFGGVRVPSEVAEQVLLEEVARTAAMVRYLEDKIGQWPDEYRTPTGLPRLVDEHYSAGPAGTISLSESERRAWLYEYRQERKMLIEVTKTAISAKLSERVVNMAEQQGFLFAQMMRAAISAADLNADQARRMTAAMPKILREAAQGNLVIGELA